jgi:hypothetical protein
MPSLTQFWIETGATLVAVLLIPFYMGFIHVGAFGAAAYAAVGGLAMAIGEQLQFEPRRPNIEASDVLLWSAAIGGSGGLAYVVALIFL